MPTPLAPSDTLRSTRLVLIALAAGVVLFALVAAYVGGWLIAFDTPRFNGHDVLAIVAVCMTIQAIPLSFFLPAKLVAAARDRDTAARIHAFRTSRIVAAAFVEGAALLWCVALLFTGNLLYVIPIAVLVALLVWHVPSRESFEAATGVRLPTT